MVVAAEYVKRERKKTPLSNLIEAHLTERQSDFCRRVNFDQGLLSKIAAGQVTHVTLSTAIKLALGFNLKLEDILAACNYGQTDLELVRRAQASELL